MSAPGLPPKPSPDPIDGMAVFELPDDQLAAFVAEIIRLAPQPLGVRFLPREADAPGRCRVLALRPPTYTLLRLTDGGPITALSEQAADARFSYPVCEFRLPECGWHAPHADDEARGACRPPPPPVRVPLALRPSPTAVESLWVLGGDGLGSFAELISNTNEETLGRYLAAFVRDPAGRTRVVLRAAERRAGGRCLPLADPGFAPHPVVPNIFVPADRNLFPVTRQDVLRATLAPVAGTMCWVMADNPVSVAFTRDEAFRPLRSCVAYTVPPAVRLGPGWEPAAELGFEPVALLPEPPEDSGIDPRRSPAVPHTGLRAPHSEGWLGRLAKRLRTARPPEQIISSASPPSVRRPEPARPRMAAWDAAAARSAAEQRVLTELPRKGPAERAELWAELAAALAAAGQYADSGIAWANAVWETSDPPPAWLERWVGVELKAARASRDLADISDWLALTAKAVPPRVVAAYMAWAGNQPAVPADLVARLPRFLDLLARHRNCVSVRAGWLARLAAARACGGDPLGLARWRDDAFRRLADAGLTLDLDAPSFLRSPHADAADRFAAARDWLARVRDPVQRWVARHATGGRLRWAGLDADTEATAAYADLLFAWGLNRIGEQAASREREETAAGILARAARTRVEADVHAVLLTTFRHRIREARQARPDHPGLPPDARAGYDRLSQLGRYAVDKLRQHSQILEPGERVNPYRGRNRPGYYGADALGRRLARLPDVPPAALPDEARSLLRLATDPGPAALPRVALALLPLLPLLPPDLQAEAAGLLPAAAEHVVLRVSDCGLQVENLTDYLADLLAGAADAAALVNAPDVLDRVVRAAAAPPDPIPRHAAAAAGVRLFRALGRLGLTARAEYLLRRAGVVSPLVGTATEGLRPPLAPDDLVFALGWYTVGDDGEANRLLDAARNQLFLAPVMADAKLAVNYAAALGHAPPRLGLSRLEELFQRLAPLPARGSTNRFFTLRPLALIDAAVRSVVSDDFALGPQVRRWLDDDEAAVRRRIARDLDGTL